MSRVLRLWEVSAEEGEQIRKLASSRKQPLHLVRRAKIIQSMLDDPELPADKAGIDAGYKRCHPGRKWVKRFNEYGIGGLEDKPRSGRPPTHTQTVRSSLISLALQKPDTLGYPFALWTLERLQRAFMEREGVHLSESTFSLTRSETLYQYHLPNWNRYII